MLLGEFEEIERGAPETVWLEFVDGRLCVKPPHDGDHASIVMWLLRSCLDQLPDRGFHPGRGLRAGGCFQDRVRPDGVLAPKGHFAGDGEWSDSTGVLMVTDVVPHGAGKSHSYAAADIPVCLLVDRVDHSVSVGTRPAGGRYRVWATLPFGDTVAIPGPVGITLETEKLKGYVR